MGKTNGALGRSARCIALVGPYLSGKTTLLEALLARTGAITRQGRIRDRNTVGQLDRGCFLTRINLHDKLHISQ